MLRIQDAGDGVQTWTLDRPPANALNAELVRHLGDAADAASNDPDVRAVVVRGNDKFFSGGLDLAEMASGGAASVMDFGWGDGVAALWTLDKPTVAEIAGHAVAGGAIIALACDVRICSSKDKKIGLNETAIGLPFPRGAFEIARTALPQSSFGRTILGGALFGPEDAKARGYVHEVVAPETLEEAVLGEARALAALPAIAYAENKRLWQEPSVLRCQNEPADIRKRRRAAWQSEELFAAFAARAAGTRKK